MKEVALSFKNVGDSCGIRMTVRVCEKTAIWSCFRKKSLYAAQSCKRGSFWSPNPRLKHDLGPKAKLIVSEDMRICTVLVA